MISQNNWEFLTGMGVEHDVSSDRLTYILITKILPQKQVSDPLSKHLKT